MNILIFVLSLFLIIHSSNSVSYTSPNSYPIPIPDNDLNGVYQEIRVLPYPGSSISSIDSVRISINHDRIGDLIIRLIHVNTNRTSTVIDRPGFPATTKGCEGNTILANFTSPAPLLTNAENSCSSNNGIRGVYLPMTNFTQFRGLSGSSNFYLQIVDSSFGYYGQLQSWSITYTISIPTTGVQTPDITTAFPTAPEKSDDGGGLAAYAIAIIVVIVVIVVIVALLVIGFFVYGKYKQTKKGGKKKKNQDKIPLQTVESGHSNQPNPYALPPVNNPYLISPGHSSSSNQPLLDPSPYNFSPQPTPNNISSSNNNNGNPYQFAPPPSNNNSNEPSVYDRTPTQFEPTPSSFTPSEKNRAEINYSELEGFQQIGKGSFGVVFRCKWRATDVAVKKLQSLQHVDNQAMEEFKSEAMLLKNLRAHPNVVLFIGITSPPQPLTIITEFCANGSLYSLLMSDQKITPSMNQKFLIGIARGMLHLHSEGIIHRDLAARNILLTENFDVKVTDFGLSRVTADTDQDNQTRSENGPLKWMPPEAIKQKKYGIKSDIWSYGVVMWEVLARREPYPNLDPLNTVMQVVHEGLRLEPPEGTHTTHAQIMKSCFETDPEKRPTFKAVCELLLPLENDPNLKMSPTFSNSNSSSNNNNNNNTTSNANNGSKFEQTNYGSMDKNFNSARFSHVVNNGSNRSPSREPSVSQYQPTPFSVDNNSNENNNNNEDDNKKKKRNSSSSSSSSSTSSSDSDSSDEEKKKKKEIENNYGSVKAVNIPEEDSPYAISPSPQNVNSSRSEYSEFKDS